MVLRVGLCLKMDPETPSATEPAETPSATEPVVRPRPPRERHLPAHLTDYEVQLPPNLHPEPPPADSVSQRPSRPSRHASNSISSGTVSSTSSRSHRSVQRRSPRHGLSVLQAAMLEERLKTLELEELEQQIEEDAIFDKECERLDAQAREAQYRQEQATKARELLAKQVESRRRLRKVHNELEVAKYVCVLLKQESRDVNVPASQSSLAVDALSESSAQVRPSPTLPVVHITAPVAESPFSSATLPVEVTQPNVVTRSSDLLVTAPPTLMSRQDYAAPSPFNQAAVTRPHHYSDTCVTYSLAPSVSVPPTVPSAVPITLGAQTYQATNPSPYGTAVPYPIAPLEASHSPAVLFPSPAQPPGQQSAIPLLMVEEILMYLPAHEVVQVCRLVCHEWKELVDSAAHWRERCKREEIQPYDASRVPEDWRLFYFQSKYRKTCSRIPKLMFEHNTGDRWVTGEIGKPFPDNTVTKCFVASRYSMLQYEDKSIIKPMRTRITQLNFVFSFHKEQLIDLKKEGYKLLDQERKAISTFHPYKVILHRNDYPWCQMPYVFKNYGPGVRFIYFSHAGIRMQITNSSVEICPAAERLRCTKSNLLKNPSAQDGLRGWKIVPSGGDCWVIEENTKPIPDTVTKCFVTSYGLCLKQQLIDLNEEGYSDSFMDQVQPHIKISDWCAPCNDCGSEYQICVELLDEREKTISTFQPEKVMFPFWNGEPWHQMTHVFKNYGPGVRFVRFTHGGQDTQYWAGHYGVRITNSSVEICPADERFTNRNLLKNPSAQEGFQGWELVENGGDGWVTQGNRRTFPVSKCFVTSCGKKATVKLSWINSNPISKYQTGERSLNLPFHATICVELLDEKKKPISTFQPEKVFFQKGKMYPWRQMTHVFMNYGPGVRFIRFTHGGKDTNFQEGQHGIQVTNSSVEICSID
ncbi:F-box only protein 6 [Labeo rohita]|uniref:F-box only protein 6 n=1 Tax=Labeo rohita TaxID=84645 RepID=A0ABQ8MI48_LABRO|nr:F-box only protein 6 [Labeo rohita]